MEATETDDHQEWYCYLLITDDSSATYVGATVNPDRRLRQHNKEIKGGARATGMRVDAGHKWRRVCRVSGFPDNHAALQFEWRWKHLSRRVGLTKRPLERRLEALKRLLEMDRPTSKGELYSSYKEGGPKVLWEDGFEPATSPSE